MIRIIAKRIFCGAGQRKGSGDMAVMDIRVSSPLGAVVYPRSDTPCGRMHIQRDGYLYVGHMQDLSTQRHSVTLYVVLEGEPFTLKTLKKPPLGAEAATVGSGVYKRFVGGTATIVSLDINPTHRCFRTLARAFRSAQAWPREHFASAFDDLAAFAGGKMGYAEANDLYRRMVALAMERAPAMKPMDPRVRVVMKMLREQPGMSTEQLAEAVNLSRDWLVHLFTEEAGITLRRYEQMLKLQAAAVFLQRGISLTEVAANAGFADLAHFSKLWKLNYGFPPQRAFGGEELSIDAIPWPSCLDLALPGTQGSH